MSPPTSRPSSRIWGSLILHKEELAGNLSYGDVALLEISIALATQPKLLLLDEPISGMSPSETKHTVEIIRGLSTQPRRDSHRT